MLTAAARRLRWPWRPMFSAGPPGRRCCCTAVAAARSLRDAVSSRVCLAALVDGIGRGAARGPLLLRVRSVFAHEAFGPSNSADLSLALVFLRLSRACFACRAAWAHRCGHWRFLCWRSFGLSPRIAIALSASLQAPYCCRRAASCWRAASPERSGVWPTTGACSPWLHRESNFWFLLFPAPVPL